MALEGLFQIRTKISVKILIFLSITWSIVLVLQVVKLHVYELEATESTGRQVGREQNTRNIRNFTSRGIGLLKVGERKLALLKKEYSANISRIMKHPLLLRRKLARNDTNTTDDISLILELLTDLKKREDSIIGNISELMNHPLINLFKSKAKNDFSDIKLIHNIFTDVQSGKIVLHNGVLRQLQLAVARQKRKIPARIPAAQNKPKSRNRTQRAVPPDPPGTTHCKKLGFSKGMSPVAMASYQGSGNTWLRHLVQEATGIYTGSPYGDPILRKGGFPGEGTVKNVITVKMHGGPNDKGIKGIYRCILLIRNPFLTILAEFNRLYGARNGNAHTLAATDDQFRKDWPHHIAITSSNWFHFYNTWLDAPGIDLMVVLYEDMKTNLEATIKKVVSFLKVEVTEDIIKCVVNNSEGRYHRKKKQNSTALYSSEAISLIKVQTQMINVKLRTRFNLTLDATVPGGN